MRSTQKTQPMGAARILLAFPVLIFSLFASAAFAQPSCDIGEQDYLVRPNIGEMPTEVHVGFYISDITSIDDVEQEMSGEFYLRLRWRDKRLTSLENCLLPVDQIWFPEVELFKSSDLLSHRFTANVFVSVGEDAIAELLMRFTGSISIGHELRDFPFDEHDLAIELFVPAHAGSEVVLIPDEAFSLLNTPFNVSGWSFNELQTTQSEEFIQPLQRTFSVATFHFFASRDSIHFVSKVLLPMALIVMMSWVVFWIDPIKFGPQIGLSATCMLTLIAFQLASTSILPRVSYFTVLDTLTIGSTVLVFLAFLEASVAVVLSRMGQQEVAKRLDRISRWVFPLAFLILCAVAVLPASLRQG